MFDFTGRSVCVTGAASGIGRATAALFADLGATVFVADRDEEALNAFAAERPDRLRAVAFDQSELASVEQLAHAVGAVDVLVNNAGVLLYEPLSELRWADLSHVISVNLTGAIALSRLVGQNMVARGRGAIVHTGSQLAYNGAEFRSVYAATKAGISQFVKTAALEWGPKGVRVNCVAPGRTLTPLNQHLLQDPASHAESLKRIPLGRFGQPQDMANAFVFMASDAAAYVTGHTLVVDGGWILP
ncbi:SDR family oxidoreductase [Castellaniella sp. GW247-6E4]|uniref:SDR family NAD(P)-dependent oxidoreductase n=1 Tax=Castellaniella sp. GW247-6E4 TaxID=3140380 RepID=UPI003315A4BB